VKGFFLSSRLIRWLAYLGGWTLFALFFISEDAGRLLYQGQPVPWRGYLVVWLTTAYAWAFLTPFVWWLARRLPIERKNWWRSGGMHLVWSVCFALIEEVLFAFITPFFGLPWFRRTFVATFRAVVPIDFHLNVIIYWLIVGVQHSVSYYRKFFERERLSAQLELRATLLESQLAQANLSALKMQLHPHFLFNTLHAIVVLVRQHSDPCLSERRLGRSIDLAVGPFGSVYHALDALRSLRGLSQHGSNDESRRRRPARPWL
jgi:hypothetical protein